MIRATEIRKGNVLKIDNKLVRITDYTHITPGNLRGIVHIKYKDIQNGVGGQARLRPDDKMETVYLDKRPMEYLYPDQSGYVFMDTENFEQPTVPKEMLEDLINYIRPNEVVEICFYEGNPVTIELAPSVIMSITETEPAVRGDTVQNIIKPATTDTGLQIKVPNHIRTGDKVKVDTRTGEFLERVNE
ncbi:MAG: elongation factor P [Planctomycetes bacterium]|nr:elongation factor P [Planctomycetota bacterium]NUQ34830.1 elongation factor P [Planctomycetaceae bacterium]